MRSLRGALLFLVLPVAAVAYQADLVPAGNRAEARDIAGIVSISGADGTVRVKISEVNDAHGDSFTGQLSVQLRLRVNGARRHVRIPLPVDTGDGTASQSLGLVADDKIIVNDIRVRGPDHRTLAAPGAVTVAASTPPPPVQPPPSECPAALVSCQSDLADCSQELDDCESQ